LWTFAHTLNDISGQSTGTGYNSPTYTSGINGYSAALSVNETIGQCTQAGSNDQCSVFMTNNDVVGTTHSRE
jgi:hypothetical protein